MQALYKKSRHGHCLKKKKPIRNYKGVERKVAFVACPNRSVTIFNDLPEYFCVNIDILKNRNGTGHGRHL
jgi:hypothetical protein